MKREACVLTMLLAVCSTVVAQDAPKVDGKTAAQWGKLLQAKDEAQRLAAAAALEEMGKDAKPALSALIAALRDRNSGVHVKAVATLTALGKDAVAALTSAVRGTDEDGRVRAIKTLGQIGPEAKSALPTLKAMLKDKSVAIRDEAAESIDRINGLTGPRAKGSRVSDFAGSWSGKADFSTFFPNAKMEVELNANGQGTIRSRPGGDSNANLNQTFSITIKSVKNGKVVLPGNWELQLSSDGQVLTVQSGSGVDRLIYRLKKG